MLNNKRPNQPIRSPIREGVERGLGEKRNAECKGEKSDTRRANMEEVSY